MICLHSWRAHSSHELTSSRAAVFAQLTELQNPKLSASPASLTVFLSFYCNDVLHPTRISRPSAGNAEFVGFCNPSSSGFVIPMHVHTTCSLKNCRQGVFSTHALSRAITLNNPASTRTLLILQHINNCYAPASTSWTSSVPALETPFALPALPQLLRLQATLGSSTHHNDFQSSCATV